MAAGMGTEMATLPVLPDGWTYYRLKHGVGRHIGDDHTGRECDWVGGEPVPSKINEVERRPEKFEYIEPSQQYQIPRGYKLVPEDGSDLVNNLPGARKAEHGQPTVMTGQPAGAGVPVPPPPPNKAKLYDRKQLEGMSVKDIQAIAADEEIELGRESNKDKIIALMLGTPAK